MGQFFAHPENQRGVRFEDVEGGENSVYVHVSTSGKTVSGRNIKIKKGATWHLGDMAEETVLALPRASNSHTQDSTSTSDPDERGEDNDIAETPKAVGLLEDGTSSSTGFERRFW